MLHTYLATGCEHKLAAEPMDQKVAEPYLLHGHNDAPAIALERVNLALRATIELGQTVQLPVTAECERVRAAFGLRQ